MNYFKFACRCTKMNIFRLYVRVIICALIMVMDVVPLVAAQIPKALAEHSIEVNWQEVREDRVPPDGEWREIQSYRSSVFYISSAGRVFRREKAVNMGYGKRTNGKGGRGSLDAGVNNGVSFGGNSMTIIAQAAQGLGARRTVVVFDPNFQSCSATIITGKSGETSSFMQRAIARGGLIETRSVRTSSVTCQIFDGNRLR